MAELKRYHPGLYIKDAIEELSISEEEFANKCGLPIDYVSSLLRCESHVTQEVTKKLSNFFNSSVDVWVNLQKAYDFHILKKRNVN